MTKGQSSHFGVLAFVTKVTILVDEIRQITKCRCLMKQTINIRWNQLCAPQVSCWNRFNPDISAKPVLFLWCHVDFPQGQPIDLKSVNIKKRRSYSISAIYLQLPTSPAPHIPKPRFSSVFHLQEDSPRIANLRHPTDGSVQTGLALQSYESGPGENPLGGPWRKAMGT